MTRVRRACRAALLRSAGAAAALCAGLVASGVPARAQAITGYAEVTAGRTEDRIEPAGRPASTSDVNFVQQRYSLDFSRRLWPNLTLLMSGLFERDSSTLDAGASHSSSVRTRYRPRIQLSLNTESFYGDVSWSRSSEKDESSLAATNTLVRETSSAVVGWRHRGIASVRLGLLRFDDADRLGFERDVREDLAQLFAEYAPLQQVRLHYTGTVRDRDDRLNGTDSRTTLQNGRFMFADRLFRDRVSISSDYSVTHRKDHIERSGEGEALLPLFPLNGLAAIDDTPELGALDRTPSLIDDNLTTGTGINIGLPPAGGELRPRTFGLDFGIEETLNVLHVWVDREIRPEVWPSFTWDIWTSDDGERWTLARTVAPGQFGPFVHRFELRFPELTARFFKVVVRPLAASVPFATEYPVIQVTELQPLRAERNSGRTTDRAETTHIYNADVRARLVESIGLDYEFGYLLTKVDDLPSQYTVINGLSLMRQLGPVWAVNARVAYEDGRDFRGNRGATVYAGSLTAMPLPTLRHSLVVSGRDEDVAGVVNRSDTVLLNTTAELYRGIDVGLGVGKSYASLNPGGRVESTLYNLTAALVPNTKTTVNLLVQERRDDNTAGVALGLVSSLVRSGEANVGFRPFPSLYLFGGYRLEKRAGFEAQTIGQYSVSWNPFPNGQLRIGINYYETILSELDTKQRAFTPNVRWNLSRRSYLNVAYQRLTTDAQPQRTVLDILTATLRAAF